MLNEIEKYKVLGEQTRFRIVMVLLKASKELCVCELEDILNVPQYNVSKHLSLLKHAGLLEERKEGKLRMYKIKDDNQFNKILFKSMDSIKAVSDETLKQDLVNLQKRLALRKNDRVVVTRN
ncbi:MAG: winged helix-turn-helix transcriptional regulator [Spirochaetes bacterium]|nr:winged helix-turn-helix transcriptional regulator [Spirochaetota bacterium]